MEEVCFGEFVEIIEDFCLKIRRFREIFTSVEDYSPTQEDFARNLFESRRISISELSVLVEIN